MAVGKAFTTFFANYLIGPTVVCGDAGGQMPKRWKLLRCEHCHCEQPAMRFRDRAAARP